MKSYKPWHRHTTQLQSPCPEPMLALILHECSIDARHNLHLPCTHASMLMHRSFCIHASIVPVHLVHQFLQQFDAFHKLQCRMGCILLVSRLAFRLKLIGNAMYFSCIVTPGHLQCDCACNQRTTNDEIPRLVFLNKGADQKTRARVHHTRRL